MLLNMAMVTTAMMTTLIVTKRQRRRETRGRGEDNLPEGERQRDALLQLLQLDLLPHLRREFKN